MQFLWLVKAHIGHLAIDRRCRVLGLHDPNLDKPATYDGSTFSFRRTKQAPLIRMLVGCQFSPDLLASAKRLESWLDANPNSQLLRSQGSALSGVVFGSRVCQDKKNVWADNEIMMSMCLFSYAKLGRKT
jgi:hypothetical protein